MLRFMMGRNGSVQLACYVYFYIPSLSQGKGVAMHIVHKTQ